MTTTGARIVRNSLLNLAGQGTYAVFHLLSIVVLARTLGVAGFGLYYVVFALMLVVQLLAEAGLGTILTRRLVKEPGTRTHIVAEAETLFVGVVVLSVATLAAIGVAFAWWRGDPALLRACTIAGVACAGIQVQRFCVGVLQAAEQFTYENAARLLQGIAFAALVVLLVTSAPRPLHYVVMLLAASHWLAAGFLLVVLHRRRDLAWPSLRLEWRGWLAEGGPLGIADVVRGLTWQLDTVLLGVLQPAAVVGIYSVAYRPLGPLNWLPRAVLSASFPSLTRLATTRDGLDGAFARSTRVLTIVSIPIAATIFVFAEPFVLIVGGPAYLEAAAPLRLLIWVAVLSFVTMHFRYVMAAMGRQREYAWLVGGVFTVQVIAQVALIPLWGYLGACAGTVGGELLFAIAGLALCRRAGIQGLQWSAVSRAAAAGAAIVPLLWLAREGTLVVLVPVAAVTSLLYLALCVSFGAIERAEVREFRAAIGRLLRPAARAA